MDINMLMGLSSVKTEESPPLEEYHSLTKNYFHCPPCYFIVPILSVSTA